MDLKELFALYDAAEEKHVALKVELEKAYRAKSDLVGLIIESVKPERKLKRNGTELTLVTRDVEVEDVVNGGVTMRPTNFIRGARKVGKKLIEV